MVEKVCFLITLVTHGTIMQKKTKTAFLFRLCKPNRENTARRQMNWKTNDMVSGLCYLKIA